MLIKTEKGRLELRPGHRSLGQRERALLLVADGQQSESKMAELFQGDGRRLIDQLLAQGYLVRHASGNAASPAPVSPPQTTPPSSHGEQFAGTRSLATARMFLFDLSERLFAPRDKALANRYRDALREARDPEAMLAVGRALIADVEALAGSERADGISERLAKLLPAGLLEAAP
ncbi:hypothetical protein [Hydrogenophaga flava]|uniref:hypothetical protein n=1 Tax=Hydrogenophaga flava TaxID=65657 RepID=UPI0008251658|nr:hypothetical protein [Hydrogenophaga flava]